LLKELVLNWIEVYIDNHIQNQANTKQDTKDIIFNWAEFREQLATMFGDIDKEHTAERLLQRLVQKRPASGYTADFRRFSIQTK
jgi:hypothetical protein